MPSILRLGVALGAALLVSTLLPAGTHAHAAPARSDPAAGAALEEPPAEIRLWFTEPLEASYTGAELFDRAGVPVAGVTCAVAPDDDHLLVVVPSLALPDGGYIIAWRCEFPQGSIDPGVLVHGPGSMTARADRSDPRGTLAGMIAARVREPRRPRYPHPFARHRIRLRGSSDAILATTT